MVPESVKTPSPTLAKASLLEAPSARTPAKFEVPKVESSDNVDVTPPATELVTVAAFVLFVRAERVWLKPAKSRTAAPDPPRSNFVCAGMPSLAPAKRLPCWTLMFAPETSPPPDMMTLPRRMVKSTPAAMLMGPARTSSLPSAAPPKSIPPAEVVLRTERLPVMVARPEPAWLIKPTPTVPVTLA